MAVGGGWWGGGGGGGGGAGAELKVVAVFGCADAGLRERLRGLTAAGGAGLLGVLAFNEGRRKDGEVVAAGEVVSVSSASSACGRQSQDLLKIVKLRRALMVIPNYTMPVCVRVSPHTWARCMPNQYRWRAFSDGLS